MGGWFPRTSSPECNIFFYPAAAVTVAHEWPGSILWQGFEIGAMLYTGQELQKVEHDNPVRRAFKLRSFIGGFAIDKGKPSHDQTAVLLSVRGSQKEYWNLSHEGVAIICSNGQTEWKPQKNGKQKYVILKVHPDVLEDLI